MAGEIHGKDTKVHIGGYDLTSYLRTADTADTTDTAESSTFGDQAKRYIAGLSDGTFTAEGVYVKAIGAVREALDSFDRVDGIAVAVWPDGDAIGKFGEALPGIQTVKSVSTDIGDLALVSMEAQSKAGIEDVVSLHPMGAEAAIGNYASVDNGASSAKGLIGYLQAPDVGTSLGVKIQHSSNGTTWVDLVSFAAVGLDHGFQRISVNGPVDRYLRAISTSITGGPATFAVAASRVP